MSDSPRVTIIVECSGQVRDRVRSSRIEMQTRPTLSAIELLSCFCEHTGPAVSEFCLAGEGKPRPSLFLCLNDNQQEWDAELSLRDGDRVQLVSAISGG